MKKIIGLLTALATVGLVLGQPAAAEAAPANPTYAYAGVTRSGTATYVHGLVKVGQQQARNGNRPVYLQRLLNGAWQTMVSRRTLSDGKVTVGFVQPASYNYRWYVPPVGYAAAALSNTVTSTSVLPPPPPVYITHDGMYRVGRDIPAGLYYTGGSTDGLGCYWERRVDAAGSLDGIIDNNYFSGSSYVQVYASDPYFMTSGTCIYKRVSA